VIENPQPVWLTVLLAALPGIAFAAFALNNAIFPRDNRPFCTIPAIGLVLALLPTHLLALVSGSLTIGLAAAWSIIGVVGYAWIARHWRECRSALWADHTGWASKLFITLLATLPIILPTILLNFHDETPYELHFAKIAHLQNGVYPPRYLYEPNLPLRYHYAFDLAGAIVTGLLRVRLDHAVDLLTLALWPCMFLLLWRLGEHVGGERAGAAVALTVCFAGGWPALAWSGLPCGFCTINGLEVNPPFISNYFQHPWSIAVPIFCLVVLQRAALSRINNQMLGLTGLVCSLSLLSLSQAALFVPTVIALGLTEIWNLFRFRDRAATLVLFSLGLSLLGAKLIGGFFASGPYPPAGGIFDTGLLVRDFSKLGSVIGQVQWNLASFGALLLFGIAGLLRAKNQRVFLIILVILTFVVVNSLRYKYNWNIVKFGSVSFVVLAIGSGIVLSHLAAAPRTMGRRIIFGLSALALVGQGAPFPVFILWAYDSNGLRSPFSIQMIRPYFSTAYPVNSDNARAVSFLRTHMGPSEILYVTPEAAEPYATWGGLPTEVSAYPADSGDNDEYGLGKGKFAARKDLSSISETWFDRLAAEHITWIATDIENDAINAVLDSPEGQRRAVMVVQYGNVRIFHLK
jgi:hypothetical protein